EADPAAHSRREWEADDGFAHDSGSLEPAVSESVEAPGAGFFLSATDLPRGWRVHQTAARLLYDRRDGRPGVSHRDEGVSGGCERAGGAQLPAQPLDRSGAI